MFVIESYGYDLNLDLQMHKECVGDEYVCSSSQKWEWKLCVETLANIQNLVKGLFGFESQLRACWISKDR